MNFTTATITTAAANYTAEHSSEHVMPLSGKIFVGIVCGIMLLVVFVGNTFVVVAVAKFRRLRTPANALLLNLAIADITVSVFVMTFSTMRLLQDGHWRLGKYMCKFWMSMDVLCCTASILTLCMISLDKYWAITRPLTYKSDMSWRRTGYMVAFVWGCSGVISFVPIYSGLYAKKGPSDTIDDICGVNFSVNRYYAVVSSMTSFYVPLAIMIFTYCHIYAIARSQAIRIKEESNRTEHLERYSPSQSLRASSPLKRPNDGDEPAPPGSTRRRSRSITREYKAVRTLGLIMGCFILSWLPFFLMYLIMNFCEKCYLSTHAENAITWLGYANSLMNPLIYNFRNRDFRYAFRVIAHRLLNALTLGCFENKHGVCPKHSSPLHRLSTSSNGHPHANPLLDSNGLKLSKMRQPHQSERLSFSAVNGEKHDLESHLRPVPDGEVSNGSLAQDRVKDVTTMEEENET
ncbi:5-hydroxytryptamine receptor 1F-like [Diadema setosum]|uniref:5-hydroxytryptamine receptor 1F-like n=1 Tax=Diadema setosum TaxID=31175 RepID=UPI003B3AB05B